PENSKTMAGKTNNDQRPGPRRAVPTTTAILTLQFLTRYSLCPNIQISVTDTNTTPLVTAGNSKTLAGKTNKDQRPGPRRAVPTTTAIRTLQFLTRYSLWPRWKAIQNTWGKVKDAVKKPGTSERRRRAVNE